MYKLILYAGTGSSTERACQKAGSEELTSDTLFRFWMDEKEVDIPEGMARS